MKYTCIDAKVLQGILSGDLNCKMYNILKLLPHTGLSNVPVLHYLQAALFLKIWTISWISDTTFFKRYQRPF